MATPDARLMAVESVIPEPHEFDGGKWMDLNMMMMAICSDANSSCALR